jgi:hypothetical protein
MQYLTDSFNKLNDTEKLSTIEELTLSLTKLKDNINRNSNGKKFTSLLFDLDIDTLNEMKEECLLTDDYTTDEISSMKKEIAAVEYKMKIVDEVDSVTVDKEKYFEPDEGWNTTTRNMKIKINMKNDINLEFKFSQDYHGYDGTSKYYKYLYIYKNKNKLKLGQDYYMENGKYFNGKKIKKNIDSMSNFQNKIKKHCQAKNLDFEKLSENEVLKLMQDTLTNSKKLKQQIEDNEKNKNTSWTAILNMVLESLDDEDMFCNFFEKFDC